MNHQFDITITLVTGVGAATAMGGYPSWSACTGLGSYPPMLITQGATYGAVYEVTPQSFPPLPAQQAIGFASKWDIEWTHPAAAFPATTWGLYTPFQCDNEIPSKAPGCIKLGYMPNREFSLSATTNAEVIKHMANAQASGLPGGSAAVPLQVTRNPLIVNANRTAACGSPPSIAGKSCDEYPFASTYEGAASGGTARSFLACGFTDPAGTGPIGFSRCMVNAGENSSVGSIIGNMYTHDRLLEGEQFYVSIVP